MTTVGSDPEFFLKNKQDEICNAIPIINFSPENRKKIDGYEFYYDNVLAECTIKPASSSNELINNIEECYKLYSKIISPYVFSTKTAHSFDKKHLKSPEALIAGCNPDNCVYTMEMKTPEGTILHKGNWIFKDTLRCAGGHLHIGHSSLTSQNALIAVRLCDIFLGLPSVLLDKSVGAKERKRLYGQPGRYRKTDYGIEYRTLSNFWLTCRETIQTFYEIAEFICKIIEDENYHNLMTIDKKALEERNLKNIINPLYDDSKVYECILESDEVLAKELLNIFENVFPDPISKIRKIDNICCDFAIFA